MNILSENVGDVEENNKGAAVVRFSEACTARCKWKDTEFQRRGNAQGADPFKCFCELLLGR